MAVRSAPIKMAVVNEYDRNNNVCQLWSNTAVLIEMAEMVVHYNPQNDLMKMAVVVKNNRYNIGDIAPEILRHC